MVEHTLDGLHGARLSWAVLGVIAVFGLVLAGSMSALAAGVDTRLQMEAPPSAQPSVALAR